MAYTTSSLVSYTKLSPNHSGQRTHSIDRITPHCVVGQLSAESICGCFTSPSRQASCNYGIGTDGRISLCVEEKNRSWCSSSNANDQRAITIECASDMSEPYAMNDKVYASLISLCTDICKRNGKKKLLWLGDKDKTLNYAPKSDEMVITVHRWFANKSCPGNWLYAQLESLDAQKEHYKNYITSRDDWTFAGLYFDEGITGTKADKRPMLLRLIEDCKAKKIDFVITKSISRLSRNTTDCLEIVRTLLSLNIPIYFEKENINTGSMESELFLSILSSMAEGESASISENNKWSIKKRFLDGSYKLGYVPYGYFWKDGEILVDPAQAEIVKRIFRELLSGKGTEAIAKELNQEQVPTKKGGCWTSTSIRDIIRNEKYTGDCIFQKTYTDSNFNRHKNDGHLDQYYVPDHHEAIISHEDFEAAAALIEQRASEKGIKKGNAKYQQRYAFSSRIICGECGNTFRRRIHSSTYGKYAAWVCNTHLEDTSRCSMLYIRDDDLKLAFTTMINKLVYCHKLVLKPYLEALQENTGDASLLNIQQLEILLEQNTEQRETLHKLMGQGYIDQILYTQENNALLSQAGEYRNQIELLNRSQSLGATKVYETERLLHFCERGEMQLEYSEELFELFVDHIEVYSRQKIGFALHCGLILKEMI